MSSRARSRIKPMRVISQAKRVGAVGLVLVHDDPARTSVPGEEEIAVPREIRRSGEDFDIPPLDHLIIGRDRIRTSTPDSKGAGPISRPDPTQIRHPTAFDISRFPTQQAGLHRSWMVSGACPEIARQMGALADDLRCISSWHHLWDERGGK